MFVIMGETHEYHFNDEEVIFLSTLNDLPAAFFQMLAAFLMLGFLQLEAELVFSCD